MRTLDEILKLEQDLIEKKVEDEIKTSIHENRQQTISAITGIMSAQVTTSVIGLVCGGIEK